MGATVPQGTRSRAWRAPTVARYVLTMNCLLWQSAIAFLALPGIVAFAVPLFLAAPLRVESTVALAGLVPLLAGGTLLACCVREFYVAGRGTLAPWAPPQVLVVSGPYRYSRNPMYVAVLLVLSGWAALFQSWVLAMYVLAIAVAFQLRILCGEEPSLARVYGEQWVRYRAQVPRWFGPARRGG